MGHIQRGAPNSPKRCPQLTLNGARFPAIDASHLQEREYFDQHGTGDEFEAELGKDHPDSRTFRLSRAAGYDLTPLLRFWGVHDKFKDGKPVYSDWLAAKISSSKLPASPKLRELLIKYMNLLPCNQKEYDKENMRIHGKPYNPQAKTKDPNHKYFTPTEARAATARIRGILKKFWPQEEVPKGKCPEWAWAKECKCTGNNGKHTDATDGFGTWPTCDAVTDATVKCVSPSERHPRTRSFRSCGMFHARRIRRRLRQFLQGLGRRLQILRQGLQVQRTVVRPGVVLRSMVRAKSENTSHSNRSAALSSRDLELSFGYVMESLQVTSKGQHLNPPASPKPHPQLTLNRAGSVAPCSTCKGYATNTIKSEKQPVHVTRCRIAALRLRHQRLPWGRFVDHAAILPPRTRPQAMLQLRGGVRIKTKRLHGRPQKGSAQHGWFVSCWALSARLMLLGASRVLQRCRPGWRPCFWGVWLIGHVRMSLLCVCCAASYCSAALTDLAENKEEKNAGAGGWGGQCTCPDGQVYWVGDQGGGCKSLSCFGGTESGTPKCNKSGGKWSGHKVTCAQSVQTCGGTANGELCKFPFQHDGKSYDHCIQAGGGDEQGEEKDQRWCHTASGWGFCHSCDGDAAKQKGRVKERIPHADANLVASLPANPTVELACRRRYSFGLPRFIGLRTTIIHASAHTTPHSRLSPSTDY